MPTNVVRVSPAYSDGGSGWSDIGHGINEGLQSVLGYYQEYQKQKRFEQQQTYDRQIKAQEMAERAEQQRMSREIQQRQMDRLDADEWEKNALAMTAEQAAQQPDFSEEQIRQVAKMAGTTDQDAPDEFGGPLLSQIQVGTEEKKVRTPLKTKKFGKSVAVADYGGEAARRAKLEDSRAGWMPLEQDYRGMKAGTMVPSNVWVAAGKSEQAPPSITDPTTGEVWGFNPQTEKYDKPLAKIGVKQPAGDSTPGGAYKAVYDKTTKEDVMANDAMIAKEPGRYGPPKKGDEGSGKPPLAGEVRRLTELRQGLVAIKGLRGEITEQDSTGLVARFAAWVPGVTNLTGWGTDAKSRQATIKLVKQIIGKGLEGGVLRKEDEAKYADILPAMGDRTEVAISKVDKLEQRLRENEEIELDMLGRAGRDMSKFSATPGFQSDPGGIR